MLVHPRTYQHVTVLSIKIPSKHLDYFQPEPLPFPPVPTGVGLIIDGITPAWLLTSLVRLYKAVAWIAAYYPPRKKAVVVYSRVETQKPGDLVDMPDE
jgi:CRISPR-associated protein Csx3